ncbi:hypothetical protein B0A49_03125 [Cryomyces minteri]|uniref:Uncharacterized protein n=1 Tax=Cryomyces minteri TaxID=331657 RepID=A0A4U0XC05_9PEZI|nr:hypothetical protein B0A49_03125 [Cryomyces minteri]
MPLRKSSTFHTPSTASSESWDPIAHAEYMPKRPSTCPKALEDLLIGAGQRRVANLLAKIDRTISGSTSSLRAANILGDPEVLPLPSFMLQQTILAEPDVMDIDTFDADCKPTHEAETHHASDSGLGSSISGSLPSMAASSSSAVTRSYSGVGFSDAESGRFLSDYATEKIHEHIVRPILEEKSLQAFHPLLKDVPRRIGQKHITSLRDLEKTLVFLAPEYSASSASYLNFCETSVRCIHATVDYLHESEQRRPSDRPYTNTYFLDLVEQIRQYAAILAATRERQAAGQEAHEMDYSPGEKISLRGGMSHNGKPAEFVREKDGKVISISTGEVVDATTSIPSSSKRPLADITDDYDEVSLRRSMARRRKSDRAADVSHTCHTFAAVEMLGNELQVSRPWMANGEGTRPSRQRQAFICAAVVQVLVSSLHLSIQAREQLQTAYGEGPWLGIRPIKDQWSHQGIGSANAIHPVSRYSGIGFSISLNTVNFMRPFAVCAAWTRHSINFHDYNSEEQAFDFNNFGFDSATSGPFGYTPAMSTRDYRSGSIATLGTNAMSSIMNSPADHTGSSFEEALTPEDLGFNHGVAFDGGNCINFNETMFQQPTPEQSVGHGRSEQTMLPSTTFGATNPFTPHLSPGAQPNITLLSPRLRDDLQFDEGYDDSYRPNYDFPLYGGSYNHVGTVSADASLFPDLPIQGGDQLDFNMTYNDPFDEPLLLSTDSQ